MNFIIECKGNISYIPGHVEFCKKGIVLDSWILGDIIKIIQCKGTLKGIGIDNNSDNHYDERDKQDTVFMFEKFYCIVLYIHNHSIQCIVLLFLFDIN